MCLGELNDIEKIEKSKNFETLLTLRLYGFKIHEQAYNIQYQANNAKGKTT